MEHSVILNREIIIKACDGNIGYLWEKKKSLVVVAPSGHLRLMVSFLCDLTWLLCAGLTVKKIES